jgi:hypothetical protein
MSIRLAAYEFESLIINAGNLETLSGVFAVITLVDGTPVLMDVDTGASIRKSVKKHPRKRTWRHLSKPVGYAFVVQYQSEEDKKKREEPVNHIRGRTDVPCSE